MGAGIGCLGLLLYCKKEVTDYKLESDLKEEETPLLNHVTEPIYINYRNYIESKRINI